MINFEHPAGRNRGVVRRYNSSIKRINREVSSRSAEAKSFKQRPGFRKKLEIDRNPDTSADLSQGCAKKKKKEICVERQIFNKSCTEMIGKHGLLRATETD